MVLFTYADYLRCKRLLISNILTLKEDSTSYIPLAQNETIYHKQNKLYRDLLNDNQEFYLFLQDFFCYSLTYEIIKYNRSLIAKDYSSNYSDIVFKLKNIPVYLFVEHQSYIDYKIPYRIYQYYNAILEDSISFANKKEKNTKIPLIIPIILYTGHQPWKLVPNFREHQLDYTYNEDLTSGKLSLSYNFINIHNFSKEELLNKHSMIAYAMAIDKCNDILELLNTIHSVYNLSSNEQRKYLYRIIKYILKPLIPKEIYESLLKKINNKEEMYMEELIERMKQDIKNRQITAENQGVMKGIDKRNVEIAKKLLERNMLIKDIADITGLTIEEINDLKIA